MRYPAEIEICKYENISYTHPAHGVTTTVSLSEIKFGRECDKL